MSGASTMLVVPDQMNYILLFSPHSNTAYGAAQYETADEGARLVEFAERHTLRMVTGSLHDVDELINRYCISHPAIRDRELELVGKDPCAPRDECNCSLRLIGYLPDCPVHGKDG